MAIKGNLVIDQGADFETTISVTDDDDNPVNLTNFTGTAQMRKHYTSSAKYDFIVTMGGANGSITLSMNNITSNTITAGRYVYDCEIVDTSTNKKTRIIEGQVTVTPQVTK